MLSRLKSLFDFSMDPYVMAEGICRASPRYALQLSSTYLHVASRVLKRATCIDRNS